MIATLLASRSLISSRIQHNDDTFVDLGQLSNATTARFDHLEEYGSGILKSMPVGSAKILQDEECLPGRAQKVTRFGKEPALDRCGCAVAGRAWNILFATKQCGRVTRQRLASQCCCGGRFIHSARSNP